MKPEIIEQERLAFSEEALETSNNDRVQQILLKMKNEEFWKRICSYSEKYWDDHHSQTW